MVLEGVIVIRKTTVTRLCYYMFSFYQECLNPNKTQINAAQECLQQNSTIAQFARSRMVLASHLETGELQQLYELCKYYY